MAALQSKRLSLPVELGLNHLSGRDHHPPKLYLSTFTPRMAQGAYCKQRKYRVFFSFPLDGQKLSSSKTRKPSPVLANTRNLGSAGVEKKISRAPHGCTSRVKADTLHRGSRGVHRAAPRGHTGKSARIHTELRACASRRRRRGGAAANGLQAGGAPRFSRPARPAVYLVRLYTVLFHWRARHVELLLYTLGAAVDCFGG